MKPYRYQLRALLLAAAGLLSGCAGLDSLFAGGDEPVAAEQTVPLAKRAQLTPQARNVFELESTAQSVIGAPQIVFTAAEHTFSDLAREYGLGYDELVDANPGIDPWLPGEGTPVLLPTQFVLPDAPRQGIVLNIASKRLFYFPKAEDGEQPVVMTYPIGIGRVGWETPLGTAEVISKARDPHWYVPASVRKEHEELGDPLPAVVPPGPDNPLGRHVLKLDMPGYLLHGTNQPYGVGMRVSHGCVRLYPEDIERLYSLVDRGEPVVIVNQPYLMGEVDGELYFEGHRPLEDDAVAATEHLAGASTTDRPDAERVLAQAATVAADARGVPIRLARNDVDEVFERARVILNTVEPDPDMLTLAEARVLLDAPEEELEDAAFQDADAEQRQVADTPLDE